MPLITVYSVKPTGMSRKEEHGADMRTKYVKSKRWVCLAG
jgi:hypothetical protein